jgi:anti-sigma-K factor RskA
VSAADHELYREDAGAYLLGALTGDELEAFEAHLVECAVCREDVESLRVAAEALPRSVEPVRPPDRLRASLIQAIREEAAAEPEAGATTAGGRRRGVRRPWSAVLGRPRAALAGGLAVVAVGLGLGVGLGRLSADDEDPAILAVRASEERAPNARGSLVVPSRRGEVAYLRVQGLPRVGRERVYEVWVKRGGEVVPQSLFDVSSEGGGTAGVNDGLEGVDQVLVTEEPAGGSQAPTTPPVLTVDPS